MTEEVLNQIKSSITEILNREARFEINDSITQTNIHRFMNELMDSSGYTDYQVVCDSSNNSTKDIDNGLLKVDINIPVKTIKLRATIDKDGVNYEI